MKRTPKDFKQHHDRRRRPSHQIPTLPEWARAVGFAALMAMIIFGDAISHAIARLLS